MNIRAFKLITGEEVITSYVMGGGDSVTFIRPRVINVQQVAPGQFGLALAPWMLSQGGDDIGFEVTIPLDRIVTPTGTNVPNAIEKEYLKMTSGIQLV